MSAPTPHSPAPDSPTAADRVRQVAFAVGSLVALTGSAIGSGAFGGTPIAEASGGALSATATLVAPGTGAFSIWSVIYVGLLVSAVVQLLPGRAQDPGHRATGWWLLASMLLNAAWILAAQAGLLGLTVAVIAVLVAVVTLVALRLGSVPPRAALDHLVLGLTTGLYLGWVLVATVANVSAALDSSSLDLGFLPETVWAVIVVVVAGAIASAVTLRTSSARWVAAGVALASAWGLAWIAVGRATDGPESMTTAVVAVVAAIVVVAAGVLAVRRTPGSPRAR